MQEQNDQSIFQEDLGPRLQQAITSVGKWAKLISVIGFAIGAFVVVIFLFAGASMFRSVEQAMPVEGFYGIMVTVFFILFFIAAAVLYFLYKGATLFQQGVLQKDTAIIAEGFNYLKRFFLVSAIVSALSVLGNFFNLFI